MQWPLIKIKVLKEYSLELRKYYQGPMMIRCPFCLFNMRESWFRLRPKRLQFKSALKNITESALEKKTGKDTLITWKHLIIWEISV